MNDDHVGFRRRATTTHKLEKWVNLNISHTLFLNNIYKYAPIFLFC